MYPIVRTINRLNHWANKQRAEFNALPRRWRVHMVIGVGIAVLILPVVYREHYIITARSAMRKERMRLVKERMERKRLGSEGFVPDDAEWGRGN